MIQVGLTGNVASGKSEVARIWAGAGIPVVSADDLAREAVAPGTPGLREVVEVFGEEVLAPDGTLDRGRVRGRVFDDSTARRRLEGILHPRIAELRERRVREHIEEGAEIVVSEVPLLYEAGLEDAFDTVVVVHAPAGERRRRLIEGRGLSSGEADRMMQAQGDPDDKRRRADHVLVNDGDLTRLTRRAEELLGRLREGVS